MHMDIVAMDLNTKSDIMKGYGMRQIIFLVLIFS